MTSHPRTQETVAQLVTEPLTVGVDFLLPDVASPDQYSAWAPVLVQQTAWSTLDDPRGLESFGWQPRLHIEAFLQLTQLFCQQCRLPVFDTPKVVSIEKSSANPNAYTLNFEIWSDQYLPRLVYRQAVRMARELCDWIAQTPPTPDNTQRLFKTLMDQLITPFSSYTGTGASTIPVLKAAHRLGIPFKHLSTGIYQIGWGSKARRLDRSSSELDGAIGAKLAQNKVATANVLRQAGLPAPVQMLVATQNEAMDAAQQIGYSVVVKPLDRDRGVGVTLDVSSPEQLAAALDHALASSKVKQAIVERQVPGTCHRLFIANDGLLYAVKRHPMSVSGDGRRTVRQLVDEAVARERQLPPWLRSGLAPLDELAFAELARAGLSADSVPDKGAMVMLRRSESTQWGGIDEDMTAVVHPENARVAVQAARVLGLAMAGVDLITTDISVPWFANGAIINEINYAPLLGGAEISRSYLPAFFSAFIDGDGKIPIEVFVTEADALAFQRQQIDLGRRCFYTDATRSRDHTGQEVVMALQTVKQRLRALLLSSDVDAIAIAMPEMAS